MPVKKRPGMTGVYVELADEKIAALEKLVDSLPLGSKADHIRLAIDRHLAHPPTVEVVALPVEAVKPPDPPPAKKPAAKPRKRKGTP